MLCFLFRQLDQLETAKVKYAG